MHFRAPRPKSLVELFALTLTLGALWYFIFGQSSNQSVKPQRNKSDRALPCSQLPGANETVVVLKTSVAELEERLPIHFDTTLQCYPNYLIFSDLKEKYQGYPLLDPLASVSSKVRLSNRDFELWRRVHKSGPDALEDEEIWRPEETMKSLDKWKWLPMIERTLSEYPDAKWYVLLETDTYLFWSTLLSWLKDFDHTQSYYFGSGRWFDGNEYGHAGAGIVLSKTAMEIVVQHYTNSKVGWERFVANSEHGDVVLGRVLAQSQTKLTPAWPVLQQESAAKLDFSSRNDGKRLWCSPAGSYHGLFPGDIAELWKFEQQWMREKPGRTIRQSDIFGSFIMPRLLVRSGRVDDWDNYSGDLGIGKDDTDLDQCRQTCVDHSSCVQYSFAEGKCKFSSVPRMGFSKRGVQSRWLLARAQRFADQIEPCPP
ncbi:hypothetical protein HII31_03057 [Pseudocercospora fuligena]|uniref:Glycosyltransferase family 31 protein n=1 Tax=Pseudocercospora fuligena TaxID=685502 RepID=A0A8H6RR92_9PEZI|nr:hypothetical protein HII31_03057 [Pseudocercospora fuligena]